MSGIKGQNLSIRRGDVAKLMPFAETLRQRRIAAGISQYALARKAGADGKAVSLMETGHVFPRANTLANIAQALAVEMIAVPQCSKARAEEYAAFLRAQGWDVEPPSARGRFW